MGKDLVIVESPSKAKTISRILGDSYKIMASVGHVRDLPEKSLGIDIEKGFKVNYTSSTRGQKVINDLLKAVDGAETIYLATDHDREGEAIAWHLYESLKKKAKTQTFKRVTFHEITKSAIQESFANPGEIDQPMVDAQQARRVVDRLVGYQVSPLLWRRIRNATSAGRVQSVAVRLICEREVEIENFKPEEYWLLSAAFLKGGTKDEFTARLGRIDGEKVAIGNEADATRYATDAEKASYSVTKVSRTPRTKRAAPPFITSTLQQAASSNLRFSPDQTMQIAQRLYEGVDSGDSAGGLITYMRTDSVNISKEAQAAARTFIEATFGKDFVPAKPNNYKSRGSAQEAHEAIRPTDVNVTPDMAKKFLDDRQLKLYRLIWNRFVASQMAPAKLSLHQVEITSDAGSSTHTYLFRASSTRVVFPGYMSVYNLEDVDVKDPKSKADADDEDEDDGTTSLPELNEKDGCNLKTLNRDQKFTEPPPRFSEATLVRELERNGVGRPSTYASIVKTIQNRDYVDKEKGKLTPTPLGREVNDFLVSNIPDLFDVTFTARMEGELDVIEQGKLDWIKMLEKFYKKFAKWLEEARTADAPPEDQVSTLLALFPDGVKWNEPEKRRGRTYDDGKFHASLQKQLEDGKPLSGPQWNALMMMAVRYEDQLKGLDEAAKKIGCEDKIAELRAKVAERSTETGEPDERAMRYVPYFEQITEWEAPEKRGKRTYDDQKFYKSLRQQAEEGRTLSDPQMNAMKRLLVKYREQIANFEEISGDMAEFAVSETDSAEIELLLGLMGEVTEWPEQKKGRYNDQSFFESLDRQFKQRRSLSPKQINALKKMVGKYAEKITDFAKRTEGVEMPKPGEKKAVVLTDVTCPKCGNAPLAERQARGRTFYGCSKYPRCKYAADSLEKAKADAEAGVE